MITEERQFSKYLEDQKIIPPKLLTFLNAVSDSYDHYEKDRNILKRTIELCIKHNVKIGAHPGFADKKHFGRKEQQLQPNQYYDLIIEQLNILERTAKIFNIPIHHVKPHGALYNLSAKNKTTAAAIARAVKDFNHELILFGLSGSHSITEARLSQLKTASEVFADRTYQNDGSLTPRSQPNALIKDEAMSLKQVLQMIKKNSVSSIQNLSVPILAETICIHGDTEFAVDFAKRINQALKENNIAIIAA